MIVIDGPIGSGKSYISAKLASALGYEHVNLDLVVKELYRDADIANKVCKCLDIDQLDLDLIGKIIFSDKQKRIKLQHLIYPYLQTYVQELNTNKLVIDGYNALTIFPKYSLGLIISASIDVREQRVIKRHHNEQLFALIDHQQKQLYPVNNYTFLIVNDHNDNWINQLKKIMELYDKNC